jgi:hypothetical protein
VRAHTSQTISAATVVSCACRNGSERHAAGTQPNERKDESALSSAHDARWACTRGTDYRRGCADTGSASGSAPAVPAADCLSTRAGIPTCNCIPDTTGLSRPARAGSDTCAGWRLISPETLRRHARGRRDGDRNEPRVGTHASRHGRIDELVRSQGARVGRRNTASLRDRRARVFATGNLHAIAGDVRRG